MSWESALISSLIYDSPIFFIAAWADGDIITMNEAILNKLGYTQAEVEGRNYIFDFILEDERQTLSGVFHQMLSTKEPLVYKTRLLTRDGRILVVVWHGRATSDISGDPNCIINIGMDVTEQGRTEERLEHLNKILYTLLRVNHIIAIENDRRKLLRSICDNLIENRGYHNAWIALFNESGTLAEYAEAGLGEDFQPMIGKLELGNLTQCAGKALSQSNIIVTENPFLECSDCPLSKMYQDRSSMTIRLEYKDQVYGLLVASIPGFLALDYEEQTLFREIAGNISLALYNIDLQKKHSKAEDVQKAQAVALAKRAEELQQSRQRIVGVQESLRKEIAQELHGSIQNRLIMLNHQLIELKQKIPQPELAREIDDMHHKLDELLETQFRPIARRLFPSVLRRGLIPALQSLCDHFEVILDIELELEEGLVQKEKTNTGLIAEQTRLAAYRIAEEALTNVVKHAKTSRVSVELKQTSDGWLALTIKDEGQGFDTETASGGIGLAVMQDYATVIGGTSTVQSAPGSGTEVTAMLPFSS